MLSHASHKALSASEWFHSTRLPASRTHLHRSHPGAGGEPRTLWISKELLIPVHRIQSAPPQAARDAPLAARSHVTALSVRATPQVARYAPQSIVDAAAARGLHLRMVDNSQPLAPQGPFSALVHKLPPGHIFQDHLRAYMAAHPECRVVDPPSAVAKVHSRVTMLAAFTPTLTIERPRGEEGGPDRVLIGTPRQVELPAGLSGARIEGMMAAAGVALPALCKPVQSGGGDEAHAMLLVTNSAGLQVRAFNTL